MNFRIQKIVLFQNLKREFLGFKQALVYRKPQHQSVFQVHCRAHSWD